MKILAIAPKGTEYIYTLSSVHAVPTASAENIRSALNNACYSICDGERQTWHVYDVSPCDPAYNIAVLQWFFVRNNKIFEGRR